jgi:hypothetical protein
VSIALACPRTLCLLSTLNQSHTRYCICLYSCSFFSRNRSIYDSAAALASFSLRYLKYKYWFGSGLAWKYIVMDSTSENSSHGIIIPFLLSILDNLAGLFLCFQQLINIICLRSHLKIFIIMNSIIAHGAVGLGIGILFGLNFSDLYFEHFKPYLPTLDQTKPTDKHSTLDAKEI